MAGVQCSEAGNQHCCLCLRCSPAEAAVLRWTPVQHMQCMRCLTQPQVVFELEQGTARMACAVQAPVAHSCCTVTNMISDHYVYHPKPVPWSGQQCQLIAATSKSTGLVTTFEQLQGWRSRSHTTTAACRHRSTLCETMYLFLQRQPMLASRSGSDNATSF